MSIFIEILSTIVVFTYIFLYLWACFGLVSPNSLFFASDSKKTRFHAVAYPIICFFALFAIVGTFAPDLNEEPTDPIEYFMLLFFVLSCVQYTLWLKK